MSEVEVNQPQVAQQQQMSGESSISDFLFGGLNGGDSPALQELRQAEIAASQPQVQTQDAQLQKNPLIPKGPDAPNPDIPKTFEEQQAYIARKQAEEQAALAAQDAAAKTGNELVNELNGKNPLAGPGGDSLIDSPLMKVAPKANATQVVNPFEGVQGLEKVNEYLASKFEGVTDINALLNKYEEASKAATTLSEVQANYNELVGGIKSLHPDLIQAMTMYEKGEDFRSFLVGRPNIDFSKNANEVDANELIRAYFPNKVSDADFEAADKNSDDYDPNVERYVKTLQESAIEKFNAEKEQYNQKVDQYITRNAEQKQKFVSSVKQSLSSIKSDFPDAPDTYVKSVEEKLLKDGIDSLFYDENGYLKADAAARFVRASDDGKDLLTQLQRIAYDNAKTDANLDVITKSQRTAPESGGMTQRQDVNEEKVKAHLQQLVGGVNQSSRF